ncbi:hypothetical protein [Streptomyces atratus]|uniref:hypothetical protein n=1 Tax=Streptomyces atratus TaxID=1893 RepID=UPI0037A2E274
MDAQQVMRHRRITTISTYLRPRIARPWLSPPTSSTPCDSPVAAVGNLSHVIDEAGTWHRLAALLPREDALQVMDAWNIGEQEGGLNQLVSLLVRQQVVIGETTRAELAVSAEAWGLWPSPLGPGIFQCTGDGCDSPLRLVEHDDDAPMTGAWVGLAPELLLVPWIACTESGHVLARALIPERPGATCPFFLSFT